MLHPLGWLCALLPLLASARVPCQCSSHGRCTMDGTCACEEFWAGKDCSFNLFHGPDKAALAVSSANNCVGGCSGHGRCTAAGCRCATSWGGIACHQDLWCSSECHGKCSKGQCV